MSENLSQAEIDALIAGMASGRSADEVAQARKESQQAPVRLYDATQVARISTDPLYVLEGVFRDFAKLLTRNIRASTGAMFEANVGLLKHTRWDEFVDFLPDTATICIFTAPPAITRAIWQVDDATTYALLSAMLGGRPAAAPGRTMTDVEARLVRNFAQEALATFAHAWAEIAPLSPSVVEVATLNQSLNLFPDREPMMHVLLEMRTGETRGGANVCMPTTQLQRLLTEHAVSAGASTRRPPPLQDTPFRETAAFADVPITAEVGRAQVSLGALAQLAPGDVIPLPKHFSEPLTVYVAGKPKLRGVMGVYRGHMALRVTDVDHAG